MAKDVEEVEYVPSARAGSPPDGPQEPEHQSRHSPSTPPPKFGKEAIRQSIVDLALSFVQSGHYLEGTAGNTPGSADGNPGGGKIAAAVLLPPSLDRTSMEQRKAISVCTAVQYGAKGYNTCAGRSGVNTGDLEAYLREAEKARAAGKDQRQWPGYGPLQLHPRRYFLKNTIQEGGKIVWGESCAGHKHFDCVGLVNYCLAEHTPHAGWCWEISQYMDGTAGGVTIVPKVSPKTKELDSDSVMNADLVGRKKEAGWVHIGMLYRVDGKIYVVQTGDTKYGVTAGEIYDPSKWSKCVRMKDDRLVSRRNRLKDGNGN
jgi:hypothetical protein